MKRCSTSLVIREMQIKTTLRYYLKPVRIAVVKQKGGKKITNAGVDVEKRELLCSICGIVHWHSHYGKL